MRRTPIKSKFKPMNPDKYEGNVDNIVCRSGWERKVCHFLDLSPNVLSWSSEEIIVRYIHPLDGKSHRYFPDFTAKVKKKDSSIKTVMIEVKPDAQTRPPNKPKRKTRRYLQETATYAVNASKWEAAKRYCDNLGWEFLVLTEKMVSFA